MKSNRITDRINVDPLPRTIISSNPNSIIVPSIYKKPLINNIPLDKLAELKRDRIKTTNRKYPIILENRIRKEAFKNELNVFYPPRRPIRDERETLIPRNFDINNLPFSGDFPTIEMVISINEKPLEPIQILMDRAAFPAGVENFYNIALGNTVKQKEIVLPTRTYSRDRVRSFDKTLFFNKRVNNWIIAGDIYKNDGSNSATIFNDRPFTYTYPGFHYSHNQKGLLSLVPYYDNNVAMFDSTFAITLSEPTAANNLLELDRSQIVIGRIISGIEIIDIINCALIPNASRRSPIIRIETIKTIAYLRRTSRNPSELFL